MTAKSFHKCCFFPFEHLTEAFREDDVDKDVDGAVDREKQMAESH